MVLYTCTYHGPALGMRVPAMALRTHTIYACLGPEGNYHVPEGTYHGPEGTYHGPTGAYHGPEGNYHGPEGAYHGPE